MDTPVSLTRALTLELINGEGGVRPLDAELRYDNRDPYAVAACFDTGGTSVCWVFGRDLLARGLFSPTGDGDVHVWPCLDAQGRAVTMIELTSPDGEALMQAQSQELSDFLRRTEALVPSGSETMHLNMDQVLAQLLA